MRFTPFAELLQDAQVTRLKEYEAQVQANPADESAIAELRAAVDEVVVQLSEAIETRRKCRGIVETCDRILSEGAKDFAAVYGAVYKSLALISESGRISFVPFGTIESTV